MQAKILYILYNLMALIQSDLSDLHPQATHLTHKIPLFTDILRQINSSVVYFEHEKY